MLNESSDKSQTPSRGMKNLGINFVTEILFSMDWFKGA